MKKKDAKKRIEYLKKEINRHNTLYHLENKPEVSDIEYDRLYKELESLEKDFPELLTLDSPTQLVGGGVIDGFVTVKHLSPMLSMDNTYSHEEVKEFDKRVKKILGTKKVEYMLELKIDGVSVSLVYENGKFLHGATRGDGTKGDNISNNLKTIKNIPAQLVKAEDNKIPSVIEIRGEAYIPRKWFEKLNKGRKENDETLLANPRNACAGSLKLLDSKETAKRHLDMFIWGIGHYERIDFDTHYEVLEYLKKSGFNVISYYKLCSSIEEAIKYCDMW